MRVQPNSGPAPLDRQTGVKKGESTTTSRSTRDTGPGEVANRDSAAIHRAAQALAEELKGAAEERPGADERAADLLSKPFDAESARQTAFNLLAGERSPGDGRSLFPGD